MMIKSVGKTMRRHRILVKTVSINTKIFITDKRKNSHFSLEKLGDSTLIK